MVVTGVPGARCDGGPKSVFRQGRMSEKAYSLAFACAPSTTNRHPAKRAGEEKGRIFKGRFCRLALGKELSFPGKPALPTRSAGGISN
jgi:hypothetical protein